MSDVGEVRASNMELIDQLQKAKAAIEKLSAIRDRQKTQIDVSWPKNELNTWFTTVTILSGIPTIFMIWTQHEFDIF